MPNLDVLRFSRGGVARLHLEIVAAGVGQTGESPTAAIRRSSDGMWFDGAGFVPTIQESALVEISAPFMPGVYYLDLDHSFDLTSSSEFLVRFRNTGANALLEHVQVIFGRLTDVVDPELCSVTGTIFTADGKRAANTMVRAVVIPVVTDSLGRGFRNVAVMQSYANQAGEFELPLVRGICVRLEIPDIGYDRKVQIPNQASALFTDL